MLRIKTAVTLMALVVIAVINWIIAIGIIVGLAGLDYLLQKEEEENLQEVKDYIDMMHEKERLRQKDLKYKKFMEESK